MVVEPASTGVAAPAVLARIRVSRGRALQRAVLRLGVALLLGMVMMLKFRQLDFRPSAVTNRIVEYSWACILFAVACAGLTLAVSGARWLLLAAWPRPVEIVGTRATLELQLGPMGTRRYDVSKLSVRYLFELPGISDEMPYESLLAEEQQVANMLPQISHPSAAGRLDRTIMAFVSGREADVAQRLRPFIEHCRQNPAAPGSAPATELDPRAAEQELPDSAQPAPPAAPFKVPRSYRHRGKPGGA